MLGPVLAKRRGRRLLLRERRPARHRSISGVRLLLADLLAGIEHDRKLMREVQVNIAIRWFAGYGLHEHTAPFESDAHRPALERRAVPYDVQAHSCSKAFDEPIEISIGTQLRTLSRISRPHDSHLCRSCDCPRTAFSARSVETYRQSLHVRAGLRSANDGWTASIGRS
jgi:hypothetical protein